MTKGKTTNNGLFRKKKVYFSQVSNEALRDQELSLKAKGLYSLIQSYITIEGFTLYKDTLKSACKDGRDSFDSAWKELKKQGYLKQYKMQGERGKICYEYELLDIPKKKLIIVKDDDKTNSPHTDFPYTGNPSYGKGGVYNNTINNNIYSKYVCKYEEHLAITEEFKNFLINNEIDKRMDLDTFEAILVGVMNNNRVKYKDRYFKKTLSENLNKGIKTLEEYNQSLEEYKKNKATKKKSSTTKDGEKQFKTRFHNINERFRDYQPEELERLLRESQKGKFKDNAPKIITKFHNIDESFRNYSKEELDQIIKVSQKNKFGENNPIYNTYLRAIENGLSTLGEPVQKLILDYAKENNLVIPK